MKLKEKRLAQDLRKNGYSVKEISKELNVSQGSVSVWVRDIYLDKKAKTRLLKRIKNCQYIAGENKKRRTEEKIKIIVNKSKEFIRSLKIDSDNEKLICALIYWCEGAKNEKYGVQFTNSDPYLMKRFIELFLKHFKIDISRIRMYLQLHQYHDKNTQLNFWSSSTGIPIEFFQKVYIKPNSGPRYREGYQGCLSIKYCSVEVAREINALAKAYLMSKL